MVFSLLRMRVRELKKFPIGFVTDEVNLSKGPKTLEPVSRAVVELPRALKIMKVMLTKTAIAKASRARRDRIIVT